jgi:hypothetical protein
LNNLLGVPLLLELIEQIDIITGAAVDDNGNPFVNSNAGDDMKSYFDARRHLEYAIAAPFRNFIVIDDDDSDSEPPSSDEEEEPPNKRMTTRLSYKQSLPQTRFRTSTY